MTRASFNYKTVNGIGSIVLENCVETKFKRLVLFGNSKQGENPSIESPKEIKNSGKYDETSGKYVIDVSVTGKNLFDISKYPFSHTSETIIIAPNEGQVTIDKGINISEGVVFDENTIYCISYDSYKVTQANSNWTTIFTFYYTDGEYRDLYVHMFYGQKKKFFDSLSIKKIRNVAIRNPWKVGIEINKVQIEKSEKPTDYEPYHEPQTLQLQLDRPLTKWDRIEKRDGVYGIVYSSKHVIFNGEETWVKSSVNNSFYLKGFEGLSKSYEIFCDKLKSYRGSVNVIEQNVILGNTTNLYVNIDGITDVETLRTWLSENNLDVYYFSKGSEFVALPQETQLALENLHANDGTTVITVDSGEVETGIEVEYAVKN